MRRPPARLSLSLEATEPQAALDLVRRVRLFAEECRQAGLEVTVQGSLVVIVRPSLEVQPEAADDA